MQSKPRMLGCFGEVSTHHQQGADVVLSRRGQRGRTRFPRQSRSAIQVLSRVLHTPYLLAQLSISHVAPELLDCVTLCPRQADPAFEPDLRAFVLACIAGQPPSDVRKFRVARIGAWR